MAEAEYEIASNKEEKLGMDAQLDMGLERYANLIDRLDGALTIVLHPPIPTTVAEDRRLGGPSKLREGMYRLSDLNDRLAALLERIDL